MRTFGRRLDGRWGRRSDKRELIALPASLFSLTESRVVVTANVSLAGVKLTGAELPSEGEQVWIKLASLNVFGTVAWRSMTGCAVRFDSPLSDLEIHQLQRAVQIANGHNLSPAPKSTTV
ncbi:MAG TPA: PilZ domain-containing protein [Xanthobacteraceae bacterium]|nr:PilZ domain-containing protein [Xanthobacteraceae bacterium]